MRAALVFCIGLMFLIYLGLNPEYKESSSNSKEFNASDSIDVDHKHKDCMEKTINLVKRFEGYSESLYICPGGYKTIGYGFIYPKVWSKKNITRAEADLLLKKHLSWCISMAKRDGLCCERASAIGSFIYNLGYGKYKRSRVRKAILEDGDVSVILEYCYASNKKIKGLEMRRSDELAMYNSF